MVWNMHTKYNNISQHTELWLFKNSIGQEAHDPKWAPLWSFEPEEQWSMVTELVDLGSIQAPSSRPRICPSNIVQCQAEVSIAQGKNYLKSTIQKPKYRPSLIRWTI